MQTSQEVQCHSDLAIYVEHSIYPRQCLSAKQDTVAFSTPEVEFYAGWFGYRDFKIPALVRREIIAPQMMVPMFHEDNQSMILVTMSGHNPAMRHLGRVHRASVRRMHENLGKHPNAGPTALVYDDTLNMSAGVCAKSLDQRLPQGRGQFGVLVSVGVVQSTSR